MALKYFKLKYQDKCKMLKCPQTFYEFIQIVKNTFELNNNSHYQFSYIDDEDDNVLISSKEDYQILLDYINLIQKPIRITIIEQEVKSSLTLNLNQDLSSLDSYSQINKFNNNMNHIVFKQFVNEMRNKYDLSYIENDDIILNALIKTNGNKEEALKLLEKNNNCDNVYYTINQFNNGMNEIAFKQLVNEMRNKFDLSSYENDDVIIQCLIDSCGDKEKALYLLKSRNY
jgi:hypothetical protein